MYIGITYRVGTVLVIDANFENFNELQFGKIFKIFVNEEQNVCFLCQMMKTESYSEELHAYEVSITNN